MIGRALCCFPDRRRRFRPNSCPDRRRRRSLFAGWFRDGSAPSPDIEIVGTLRNGQEAVDRIEEIDPDIVLSTSRCRSSTACRRCRCSCKRSATSSSSWRRRSPAPNSEVSLKAISLGAVDCIPKPESGRDSVATNTYRQGLIDRVRRFGAEQA